MPGTRALRPARPVDPHAIVGSLRGRPGAYVHVPFCTALCPFCPYNKELWDAERGERYFRALQAEIDLLREAGADAFTSLYVGGGTPTIDLDALGEVAARLPVSGMRAVELLPAHATPRNVARLRSLGFDAVSLGAQSFDQSTLRRLGRPGSAEGVRRALENVRDRFACVDVDLIFDTSWETPEVFLRDLATCFRAGVDQVSTYPLMRFGYTPLGSGPHDRRVEHAVLRRASRLAASFEYERRAVWTFHRPGRPTYSSITRELYLGFGAGAATFTGRRFLVNAFAVDDYVERVERGELPIAREVPLGELKSAAYYLFWQLYAGAVDERRLSRLFPGGTPLRFLLGTLAACGLVRRRGGTARLTRRGYDVFHDLEQWVTYAGIEKLWAELRAEAEVVRGRTRRARAPLSA